MIIIDDHCWQRQVPEHHKRNIKNQEWGSQNILWDGTENWRLVVCGNCWSGFAHSSTWQLSDALYSAPRQSRAERQCGESWHTVTVTLSQMRQQKLPRTWGPRTQGPPKNTHCWQQTIGLLETNWSCNLLTKELCLVLFSAAVFEQSQCLGCQP